MFELQPSQSFLRLSKFRRLIGLDQDKVSTMGTLEGSIFDIESFLRA